MGGLFTIVSILDLLIDVTKVQILGTLFFHTLQSHGLDTRGILDCRSSTKGIDSLVLSISTLLNYKRVFIKKLNPLVLSASATLF